MVPLPWAKLKGRGQRGRKALWVILYLASWIICSICFGINASNTIRAYFEGATIMTTMEKRPEGGMVDFPTLVLCSERTFKDPELSMLHRWQYLDNTYDPDSYYLGAFYIGPPPHPTIKLAALYTYAHGQCFMFRIKQKIRLNRTVDTRLFILDKGEEFLFHHNLGETELTFPFISMSVKDKLSHATMEIDYYKDETSENKCSEMITYTNRTSCLLRYFEDNVLHPNCTTLWAWSMLWSGGERILPYKPCTMEQYQQSIIAENTFGDDIVKLSPEIEAACKKPCTTQNTKIVTLDKNSEGIILDGVRGPPVPQDVSVLLLMFSKDTVTVRTKSYRIGFNDLISAVGGGLGLFLGFSLLNLITSAYNMMHKDSSIF